jgi:outer membrane protein OmpA-like peptidoglycan-associated protein
MRLLGLAALTLATGAQSATQELRFVACPIYRDVDAGKKSGCWLADDPATGARYDISVSASKPDWNHAVLVEGRVAAEQANPCGGVVLDPARVSILPDACTRAMLPAESFTGRKFALPTRNVRPLYAERKRPERPFQTREFVIPFEQGSDFVTYQLSDYYLDQAANYALDVQPARVEIVGHAATSVQTVSGVALRETSALAKTRAEKVAEWLRLRGVPEAQLKISTQAKTTTSTAEAFDGLVAPSPRRVEVRVIPIGSTPTG